MSTEFHKDFLVEENEVEEPPTKEDCCNSGCTPCVFDIYQKRMEEKKKRRREKGEDQCRHDLLSQTTFKPFIVLEKSDFGECCCRLTFQPVVRKIDLLQVKQKDFNNIKLEGLGERDSTVDIGRNEYKDIDLEKNERTDSIVKIGHRDPKNIHLKGSSVTDLIIEIEQNVSKNVTLGENKVTYSTGEMGQSGSWSINLEANLGTNLQDRIEQNDSKNNDSEHSSRKNFIVEIQQNNSENVTTEDENERDLGTNLLVGIERSDVKNINLEENLSTDLEVEIQQKDLENVTTEDEREIDVHEMDVNVDLKIMSKGEANVEIDLDDPKDSKDMDFEREDDCTSKLLGEENAKIDKEKRIGDLSGIENVEIIKEQKIDGYLPYKPGQHLTMKSWRIEKSEDEQNIEDIPQYAREASMGTKTQNYINRNQNTDEYLMSEEEFEGSEKSDSITRTEATNFVNKNEDFTSYSNSKEEIMESEEYNLNATIETPYLINRNKNLPPYSISKEKIMGTKKPNFITRDYTPITLAESSSNCCFQIIIKYYEDGEMSRYLKSLKPGDITYFRGPYGDFQYLKNHKHILAICMGTGLAPIYPIFKSILNDETDETFLKLLYGSKDPQSIILRDELRDMAKFWNFGAEMFLTEGKVEGEKFGENFRAGRIGEKCVYENLKPKQLVLVCGSEIFTQEIVRYLSEFDRWRVEYFVF